MAHGTRTRLDPERRRAQLVELGRRMLSTRPLDQVAIDDIAAEAGISRGLLFHYFPTKRDFHVAVARSAAGDLLGRIDAAAGPDLPPSERVRAGVEAFVDHVTANRAAYVAFIRGSGGGDPELAAIHDDTRTVISERVLDGLAVARPAPPRVRAAVRGWVAFAEEVTVDWLAHGGPTGGALARREVVALIEEALTALVTLAGGPPPDGPAAGG